MKKLALMFFAGSILISCVNEDYDFSKIDGTAVIMQDFALPIGSLEKMMLKDIISLDTDGTIITKDENGNLAFQLSGSDPFKESITVPSFTIPFSNGAETNKHSFSIDTGVLAGKPTNLIPGLTDDYKIIQPVDFEKVFQIDENNQLPYQVVDAQYVELDMLVDYMFDVNEGTTAYIERGFYLDFPDWITIEKADNSTFYSIETIDGNKNVVLFNEDVQVKGEQLKADLVLDLKIKRVDFPEGSIVPDDSSDGKPCKKVQLKDVPENYFKVGGKVYILAGDYEVIPQNLSVDMQISFEDVPVKAANVSLDMGMNFEGHTMSVNNYPDFFTGDDVVLDIYDAFLSFDIDNGLPLELELNADFEAYKNSILTQSMHLGDDAENGTTPIVIDAHNKTEIIFSKLGTNGSIKVPVIGEMLKTLPDQIKVSDINISCSQDYIDIVPGTNYECSLAYKLYAPLAFGKDFRFAYNFDIENIGLDLGDYGIKSASVIFNAINSLPLNFDISAQALDAEGQPSDVALEVKGSVASGTQNNPAVSPIEIRIKSADKAIQLNTLKLNLAATAPSDAHLGTPLNEAQGLQINNLALRLPDGITVDMTSIFKMDPSQEM